MKITVADCAPVDWALLPRDLLISVLERLVVEVSDYVHFAAVCKDWLSAARDYQAAKRGRLFFPELLIPAEDKSRIYRGQYVYEIAAISSPDVNTLFIIIWRYLIRLIPCFADGWNHASPC